MRIIIKNNAGAQTVLCDGSTRGIDKSVGPSQLRLSGKRILQVQSFLRAEDVKVYNRKNRQVTVSFSVIHECVSPAAASAWLVDFEAGYIQDGTLYLIGEVPNGAPVQRTLSNAGIEEVIQEQIGVSILLTFNIIGGKLQ